MRILDPGPVCWLSGCERPYSGKGMCSVHNRQYKAGKPLEPIRPFLRSEERVDGDLVRCTKCNTWKHHGRFSPGSATVHQVAYYCKECNASSSTDYRFRNPGHALPHKVSTRERSWLRSGIIDLTYDRWWNTLECQGWQCRLCGVQVGTDAHADHDHETGRFRAALCGSCNVNLVNGYESLPSHARTWDYMNRYLELGR